MDQKKTQSGLGPVGSAPRRCCGCVCVWRLLVLSDCQVLRFRHDANLNVALANAQRYIQSSTKAALIWKGS